MVFIKILSFNAIFKGFYFNYKKIIFLKNIVVTSIFHIKRSKRFKIFLKNFIKLEYFSGFKPLIKKFYAKRIDKKKIELYCVMRTWINVKHYSSYLFDFIFSYFSGLSRIINKCYKTKSLLFSRRPAVSKYRIRNYFQVNIQNLFNLVGVSKKKKV